MNTAEAKGRIVRRWPQNWPLRPVPAADWAHGRLVTGPAACPHLGAALRPVMRRAAARLWRDDLAHAERRYQLRSM